MTLEEQMGIKYYDIQAIDVTSRRKELPSTDYRLDGVAVSFGTDDLHRSGGKTLGGRALETAVSEMSQLEERELQRKLSMTIKSGYPRLRFSHSDTAEFPETKPAPEVTDRQIVAFIEYKIDTARDDDERMKVAGDLISMLTNAVTQAVKNHE